MIVGAAGCRPATPPQDRNRVRVVSLSPNLTEMICALGAADHLVGRSSACAEPAAVVRNIPVAGDFGVPSLEFLAAARPDWVVTTDVEDKGLPREIERLGIRYRRLSCRTLDDIPSTLRELGRLLRREAGAEARAAEIARGLAALRAQPPPEKAPRVYVEIWGDPMMSVGGGSFISELVKLAGGVNIMEDVKQDYFHVSPETVVARNPDIILLPNAESRASAVRMLTDRAGWSGVRAVREGRVIAGPDPNLIEQPGPRILQAVERLRRSFQESAVAP